MSYIITFIWFDSSHGSLAPVTSTQHQDLLEVLANIYTAQGAPSSTGSEENLQFAATLAYLGEGIPELFLDVVKSREPEKTANLETWKRVFSHIRTITVLVNGQDPDSPTKLPRVKRALKTLLENLRK